MGSSDGGDGGGPAGEDAGAGEEKGGGGRRGQAGGEPGLGLGWSVVFQCINLLEHPHLSLGKI